MMSKKKYGTGQTKPIAYDLKDIGLQELMAHEAMGHASYAAPQKLMAGLSYDWNDDARSLALVNLIRVGMDYKTFEKVTAHIPLKDKEWATILDTTLRTLLRYKKDNKTFAPTQTEKIIAIQQLVHFGETVFGDADSFHVWLALENVGLGGIAPKTLLDTSIGLGMVKDALGRLEHGVLA